MRTHTYTMNKGYDAPHKGQTISWPVPDTSAEAISNGFFKDEATLVRYAVAQLNIKKGHAVQEATKERPETKDGKTTGIDGSKLSIADLTTIATGTMADTEVRARGTGNAKENAKIGATAKQKATELAKTATPEQLALLKQLGLVADDSAQGAATTAAKAPTPAKK